MNKCEYQTYLTFPHIQSALTLTALGWALSCIRQITAASHDFKKIVQIGNINQKGLNSMQLYENTRLRYIQDMEDTPGWDYIQDMSTQQAEIQQDMTHTPDWDAYRIQDLGLQCQTSLRLCFCQSIIRFIIALGTEYHS